MTIAKQFYRSAVIGVVLILGLVFLLGRSSKHCEDPQLQLEVDSLAIKSIEKDIAIRMSQERVRQLEIRIDTLEKNATQEPPTPIINVLTRTYRGISVQSLADSLMSKY